MSLESRQTKVGSLYESHYPNRQHPETIYRFLRLDQDHVVWLEGKGQRLGERGIVGNIGLLWEECTFDCLAKESQKWLLDHHANVVVAHKCVCDSLALFHAGCQCGHLKLLKAQKKA